MQGGEHSHEALQCPVFCFVLLSFACSYSLGLDQLFTLLCCFGSDKTSSH